MGSLHVLLIDLLDEATLSCLKDQLAHVFGLMAASRRQSFDSDVALLATSEDREHIEVQSADKRHSHLQALQEMSFCTVKRVSTS